MGCDRKVLQAPLGSPTPALGAIRVRVIAGGFPGLPCCCIEWPYDPVVSSVQHTPPCPLSPAHRL